MIELSEQIVGFDPEYSILVDQMGLPLPHSVVVELLKATMAHLRHSKLEMEAIARRLAQENCPRMESQLRWEFFTDGFGEKHGFPAVREMIEKGVL